MNREERLAGAAILATALLIAASIALVTLVRPAEAVESRPDYAFEVHPNDVTNNRVLQEMRLEKLRQLHDRIVANWEAEQARLEEERIAEEQAAWEAEQAYYAQTYYAPSYSGGTYYAEYSDAYNTDGPSHTMPGWHDGYLETYYNASSHYLAGEWTLDSEGFYHDSNGRYVVGVDINDVNPDTGQQYQYGDVVDTGKGEGVVYDYGQGAHVHDFATAW